jgi:hypothetical protein
MNWSRNLTLVLAIAAGFIGGSLSHYVTLPTVHAEAQATHAVEIRAQRFTFVDGKGHVIASFISTPTRQEAYNPRFAVALIDAEGHELWASGGSGLKPLAENPR